MRPLRFSLSGWKFSLVLMALTATVSTVAAEEDVRNVQLAVNNDGSYLLAGKPVAQSELRAKLRALKATTERLRLHVTGSPNVEYRQVAEALRVVQEEGLGLTLVGHVAEPPSTVAPSAPGR